MTSLLLLRFCRVFSQDSIMRKIEFSSGKSFFWRRRNGKYFFVFLDSVFRTADVAPLDRHKRILSYTVESDIYEGRAFALQQRRQKFRKKGVREGRRTAFQSGFLPSRFRKIPCSGRPASRRWNTTRTLSLTRENARTFFRIVILWCLSRPSGFPAAHFSA